MIESRTLARPSAREMVSLIDTSRTSVIQGTSRSAVDAEANTDTSLLE